MELLYLYIEDDERNIKNCEFNFSPKYNIHYNRDKAYAYNDDYYKGIIKTFSTIGKSSSEINQLIFGNYIETAEHEKRPLSKLTRDILEQIGLK
ncbi:MAG: hypothetical protein FWD60_12620 [Candidatus Azobacteroides sp.]|nr:hypothetical protein [Candidatus Azobacteroides sp.]